MCKLNNDHFTHDADELQQLNDFDDTLSQARPRHDLYSKAHVAVREIETLQHIQKQLHEACHVVYAGRVFARADGSPDRPGTVRKPGVRRVPTVKQRYAIFSAK